MPRLTRQVRIIPKNSHGDFYMDHSFETDDILVSLYDNDGYTISNIPYVIFKTSICIKLPEVSKLDKPIKVILIG